MSRAAIGRDHVSENTIDPNGSVGKSSRGIYRDDHAVHGCKPEGLLLGDGDREAASGEHGFGSVLVTVVSLDHRRAPTGDPSDDHWPEFDRRFGDEDPIETDEIEIIRQVLDCAAALPAGSCSVR